MSLRLPGRWRIEGIRVIINRESNFSGFFEAPHHTHAQGRRQEFFQGRALGGSRGGLPAIFQFPGGGGGSTPIFGRFNGQNERIFRPGGGHGPPCLCLPTPLPTHYVDDSYVVCSFKARSHWHSRE